MLDIIHFDYMYILFYSSSSSSHSPRVDKRTGALRATRMTLWTRKVHQSCRMETLFGVNVLQNVQV